MSKRNAISPTREQNFPEWFQQVIKAADLAEHAPVRGCMVIKPWGYALWENIQRYLDDRIKETGHDNAYFPLFIPLSYFQREAEHVEGFATECAVVTHHRLQKDEEGELQPASPLEEPLIVRPTSEMMIGEMFAKWIESYRDLPLKLNQWANVVRWEMRPRLFLRTAEFLWQEGHTAHATQEEALEETLLMLSVYVDFVQNVLAIPVVQGEKSAAERFPGAVSTYTFEAMMQDGKALQGGTSHFLGQNFSQAASITYRDVDGEEKYAWTTSWGFTTRLIGALIMVHGDDDGLILPPRIASQQIVIIPIVHSEEARESVHTYCDDLAKELRGITYHTGRLSVNVDKRDIRGGEKTWSWIKKGVPLRIEVGPREVEQEMVAVAPRLGEKKNQPRAEFIDSVTGMLDEMHDMLYKRALKYREENTHVIDSKDDFYAFFKKKSGFVLAHWSGDAAIEKQVKQDLGVTIRCILDGEKEAGTCIFSGEPSPQRVVFAKSY